MPRVSAGTMLFVIVVQKCWRKHLKNTFLSYTKFIAGHGTRHFKIKEFNFESFIQFGVYCHCKSCCRGVCGKCNFHKLLRKSETDIKADFCVCYIELSKGFEIYFFRGVIVTN